jgi:hypothetical protein
LLGALQHVDFNQWVLLGVFLHVRKLEVGFWEVSVKKIYYDVIFVWRE